MKGSSAAWPTAKARAAASMFTATKQRQMYHALVGSTRGSTPSPPPQGRTDRPWRAAAEDKVFLSQLERGLTSVSVPTLLRVCEVLRIGVGELFAYPDEQVVDGGSRIDMGGEGVAEYLLTPVGTTAFQVFRSVIEPGGSTGGPYRLDTATASQDDGGPAGPASCCRGRTAASAAAAAFRLTGRYRPATYAPLHPRATRRLGTRPRV